jgi:hypothetical protein
MKSIRRILVLLLVLAYAGQALVASALPCTSMNMGTAVVADVLVAMPDTGGDADMTAHAGHHMSTDAATEGAPVSCCDGGLCSMSQCQSAPALPQTLSLPAHEFPVAYAATTDFSSPIHPLYSLYRPPISR